MTTRFDTDKYESGYVPHYLARVKSPHRVLEVGVRNGGSLLLWCELWAASLDKVVGIDINPPLEDLHPKVAVFQADQTDEAALRRIASAHGPFDLVIDDASHLGGPTWSTFQALWPSVTPGGIYVIEDWAVGYSGTWPDGQSYVPRPAPGHIAGIVGTVKRLLDEIENGEIERLELLADLAFAYKRS